jgi:hypothetical protein
MGENIDCLLFLENNGRHLSEINPGSKEIAISINHALTYLEMLEKNGIIVLGGDVLTS